MSYGAIGKAQRNWVLERDNHRCQHFSWFGRWVQCKETMKAKLHVHHILPQRWIKAHLPWIDPHRPENLIVLCIYHHNGENGVHPDMHLALMNYRGGDKESFADTMKGRAMLVMDGKLYWDPSNDWQYKRRAKKQTARFSRLIRYPEKRRRKEWRRPKSPLSN